MQSIPPEPLQSHQGARIGDSIEDSFQRTGLELFRPTRGSSQQIVRGGIDKDERSNDLRVEVHEVLRVKTSQ